MQGRENEVREMSWKQASEIVEISCPDQDYKLSNNSIWLIPTKATGIQECTASSTVPII